MLQHGLVQARVGQALLQLGALVLAPWQSARLRWRDTCVPNVALAEVRMTVSRLATDRRRSEPLVTLLDCECLLLIGKFALIHAALAAPIQPVLMGVALSWHKA